MATEPARAAPAGLSDLEGELSCSICTEILYQPLTLLDCLHIFCGSCLKLWFACQAANAANRHTNPYTCPSCRATVRGTRPDAKITTLLEMLLQANPSKAKTTEEKEDVKMMYTPGENVIPKPGTARPVPAATSAHERRMIEEVRAMSLRESNGRGPGGYERGINHSTTTRERRRDEAVAAESEGPTPHRQVEHQSSLRSMISSSDGDSSESVDAIIRQITEDGLLEGIDLHNVTFAQLDELSERIADAYRQRHPSQARATDARRGHQRREHENSSRHASRSTGPQQPRSTSAADQPSTGSTHPPVSRPHLLEADAATGRRRRNSSESRSGRASRSSDSRRESGSTAVRAEAARSATDLSDRPRSSSHRERRPSDNSTQRRRSTEPRPEISSSHSRQRRTSGGSNRQRPSPATSPRVESASGLIPVSPPNELAVTDTRRTRESTAAANAPIVATEESAPIPAHDPGSSQPSPRGRSTLYKEPSVSCDRCGKRNIQYDTHYFCPLCMEDRDFNVCHRCYRSGNGCLYWFGFGSAALPRFQSQVTDSPGSALPHALLGKRYQRPRTETVQSVQAGADDERRILSTEDPITRRQVGVFCATCQNFADDCFWRCDICNDGEWGFCNTCVNQGRCCTHPLLPLASADASPSFSSAQSPHLSPTRSPKRNSTSMFTPLTTPNMIQQFPASTLQNTRVYRPLTFTVHCDICHLTIPPSGPRYHCFSCSDGDYDLCSPCYANLITSGRLSGENGDKGWRRCLQGHRMVVIRFSETPMGLQRSITRDLVGGVFKDHSMRNIAQSPTGASTATPATATNAATLEFAWMEGGERKTRTVKRDLSPRLGGGPLSPPGSSSGASSNATGSAAVYQFPPDGGVGMRFVARWPWVPAEGANDELAFPRGAEIREALEISTEWAVGAYAGATGVFPRNYVLTVGMVSM